MLGRVRKAFCCCRRSRAAGGCASAVLLDVEASALPAVVLDVEPSARPVRVFLPHIPRSPPGSPSMPSLLAVKGRLEEEHDTRCQEIFRGAHCEDLHRALRQLGLEEVLHDPSEGEPSVGGRSVPGFREADAVEPKVTVDDAAFSATLSRLAPQVVALEGGYEQ
jgi:hypothetical protein